MMRLRAIRSRLSQYSARVPIRWRLMLMSFGLLAVLLGGLGTIISVSEEHTLLANQAVALRREARLAGSILRPYGLGLTRTAGHSALPAADIPAPAVDSLVFLVSRLDGGTTGTALYTATGTHLYSGFDTRPADASFLPASVTVSPSAIHQAVTTLQADDSYLVATDSAGARQLVVLLPIEDIAHQTTVAVLQVSTPTAAIDGAVNTTRLVMTLGIFGALCVAAALMFPLMSAGLRPLVAMEQASERIAAGALSLRLEEPPTHDEIGQLARSFNSMVAQLEAAFARQKQFVADVSHELRTPLTALGGGLEMLMLGADRGDAEAGRRLTRGMYREVERMRRLVEDLLTLARLDEGHAHLRSDTVPVVPLLTELAEQSSHLEPSTPVRTEIASDVPPVRADSDRLRQTLLILLDNALKYTPSDGTVTLAARTPDPEHVELQVRDTGRGIPAEDLPHVFERFYRVDPARVRSQGGGAGLGLSIAKSLIEAQDGTIQIASALGEGTVVTIRLSAARMDHGGERESSAILPASSSATRQSRSGTDEAEVASNSRA